METFTGKRHYTRPTPPPLVCLCSPPLAHPLINFGECYVCRRKPMALIEQSVFG